MINKETYELCLDVSFVSGSHVGELIVWDTLGWTVQACECNFWDPSPQLDAQREIKLCQKPNDVSIRHLTWDEEVKKVEKISIILTSFTKLSF